ncbi:MAG: NAD(P)/FAD-dependent oxidoreductase [Bauldia sp.]|nr:NAD(P)/FAD-dependent oxidoreductase [Bauldia sp.]
MASAGSRCRSPAVRSTWRPPVEHRKADVVIIGAGFGGLACARALGGSGASVIVVDRHNYNLFVPLLYQVATAALSPADIARPIRQILGRHKNIDVVLDEVQAIDIADRRIALSGDIDVTFGRLVIAAGSSYSYFGHDDWEQFAPGPRSIADARIIRARLLLAFERADMCTDPAERRRMLTTVVVGGGPTGVEMAGAVAELTRDSLAREFRHIDPRESRILLVEAGPRLLPSFAESLSDYARSSLTRLGVEVMTGHSVASVDAGGVEIDGKAVGAGCVIWGAGVKAAPAAAWLGVAADRQGRVAVEPDLSVTGFDGIYVIGDCAALPGNDGRPLPALAQVADQQGKHLGKALRRNLADGTPLKPFRFRNRGDAAIIGRNAAIVDFGRVRLTGRIGWMLWALVHIYLLTGFDNRLLVAIHWFWQYLTYQRGARLITDDEPDSTGGQAPFRSGLQG